MKLNINALSKGYDNSWMGHEILLKVGFFVTNVVEQPARWEASKWKEDGVQAVTGGDVRAVVWQGICEIIFCSYLGAI